MWIGSHFQLAICLYSQIRFSLHKSHFFNDILRTGFHRRLSIIIGPIATGLLLSAGTSIGFPPVVIETRWFNRSSDPKEKQNMQLKAMHRTKDCGNEYSQDPIVILNGLLWAIWPIGKLEAVVSYFALWRGIRAAGCQSDSAEDLSTEREGVFDSELIKKDLRPHEI
jgi:hypothetical protein